ncbi:MAG: hypothetical protein JRE23_08125 [Deltaproteobacteria bacterium]|nr:hypothetical protein [Deltaproteobacteria bacterium]
MTTYHNDIAPVIGVNMNFCYQPYILNQEAATKYFKIVGITNTGGWTPGAAQELGAISKASGRRFICTDLIQRTTPTVAASEDITLRVSRYADAAYSVWEEDRDLIITHNFIDSNAMTSLYEDDFNDGTVQGWAGSCGTGAGAECSLVADSTYYISSTHSLRSRVIAKWVSASYTLYVTAQKDFVIPSVTAYAVLNVMFKRDTTISSMYIYEDGIPKVYMHPSSGEIPIDSWNRFVIPLTPNGTRTIQVKTWGNNLGYNKSAYIYLDDIKIVY